MTNKNLTVIKNADLIISMDDARRVLNNYDILISDGQIQKVEKNIRKLSKFSRRYHFTKI